MGSGVGGQGLGLGIPFREVREYAQQSLAHSIRIARGQTFEQRGEFLVQQGETPGGRGRQGMV